VLAAATSGELTREWRVERGVAPPTETTLGDVLKVSSGKFLPAKEMTAGGTIPVFGGNGINGYHDKANVEEETLVIGRVGFYCGSVHLTPSQAWVTDNALIVRHDSSRTLRRFLYFALQAIDLRVNDSSTAQPVISGAKIYPTPIVIPDVLEQLEIVRRLDALFELAEELEKQHANVAANVTHPIG
jgi:type I restriction enzyme S subunit